MDIQRRFTKKHIQPGESKPKASSWGSVAGWYDDYLENSSDSYQEHVIAPNLLRVLSLQKGERVLDLACGQGFFTRKFADAGALVVGADISRELIEQARIRAPNITFHITPAHQLAFASNRACDVVTCVLAIQNIENMREVIAETHRVLRPGGRLVLVMNHPAFRIPKRTSWGWDEEGAVQFRRTDGYLSSSMSVIDMHPGHTSGEKIVTYHRSLQDFFKAITAAGFMVSKLEEWISHKKSQKGPRGEAEDVARKEIPLFLMLEARKN